jgi:hypothetical protein
MLSALTYQPLSVIRAMTPSEIKKAVKVLRFYFDTAIPVPVEPPTSFTHEGVTYDIPTDLSARTFGEFVDFDEMITAHLNEPKPGSQHRAVLEAMVLYCRPAGEKYAQGSPEEIRKLHDKRRKSFETIPVTTVEGVGAFFTSSGTRLETAIRTYGASHLEAVRGVRTLVTSTRRMAGWQFWETLVAVIQQKRMKSRIAHVEQSFLG